MNVFFFFFSSMDWNDSGWVTVDLPHTWNAQDALSGKPD